MTALRNSNEEESALGDIIGEERARGGESTFRGEPNVPPELQGGLTKEEMEQPDAGRAMKKISGGS